ncbi:MAG: helix-turn-helix domain-containing protein [Treponema sp.]
MQVESIILNNNEEFLKFSVLSKLLTFYPFFAIFYQGLSMFMKNLQNLMTIAQAAEYIGVTPLTLRNWDKTGKLQAVRNPLNGYRMYDKEELDKFLSLLQKEGKNG